MATNNAIALTATGLVGYDGAGNFTATSVTTANILSGGGSSDTIVNIAPPNNNGTPLISQGASTTPVFGTALVRGGGTGLATLTAFELMAAGTTSTGVMQQISSGTSGQILVSTGSGSLPSFQTIAGVTAWSDQGTSFAAVAANGYFATAALTATLPASPSEGQTITVYADTGSSVVVQANTGQTIRIAAATSSSGGTATSATQGNSVTLVYRSASTTWNSPASQGSWVLA